MAQPRTLGWFVSSLREYEELRAINTDVRHPSGGIIAVAAGSAEAAARIDNYKATMRVSGEIAEAAGNGRIRLLCDELDNNDGLTSANVVKLRAKVCRAKPCTLEVADALTLDEVADILDANCASGDNGTPKQSLRTPNQLLEAFASAAAKFTVCPRMFAFQNSAREDGLVTIPSSFVPRKPDGRLVVGQLSIGGTAKTVFGSESTFYGIGGAQMTSECRNLNVGFVLYGRANDEAVTKFRELGNEAGVIVHLHDLVSGIQSYSSPLVLWSLTVFETLQGSAWLSRIDSSTEVPTSHFNPFTASVETLKRIVAPEFSRAVKRQGDADSTGARDVSRSATTKQNTKRSTERGEGQAKLIAALTKHHEFADNGCVNLEPIGNNELARLAGVSASTASAFFKNEFDGHTKYRASCTSKSLLVAALKLLNQEFSPHHLYGADPPGEGHVEVKD